MALAPFIYEIFALGDTAITIELGNRIDKILNEEIISRYYQFKQEPLTGMIEAVPAYCSLTIYYDIAAVRKKIQDGSTAFEYLRKEIERKLLRPVQTTNIEKRVVYIPVCYENEFAPDIDVMIKQKKISREEIIRLHTSSSYRVYMMGFLPGFAYMGVVDESIAAPRKSQPVSTAAGSVGIAGRQTGIYPLDSPGGWQIIGRTPLQLFDPSKLDCSLLRTGDEVKFFAISKDEFYQLKKE
jgi:inhibitor of KinA